MLLQNFLFIISYSFLFCRWNIILSMCSYLSFLYIETYKIKLRDNIFWHKYRITLRLYKREVLLLFYLLYIAAATLVALAVEILPLHS